MDLKQIENYEYHATELKYSGFGERLNEALKEKLATRENFQLTEKQNFEKANGELTTIQMFPDYTFNEEKDRHYFNGVYAAIDRGIIVPEKSRHVDVKAIVNLITNPPVNSQGSPDAIALAQEEAAHSQKVSTAMKEVAQKDPALFHQLMVKFNPKIDFTLTDADKAAQEKIREDMILAQFFPRKERLSTTKMGYLLLGNFVHQVKYKDNVEMKAWISLNFQPDNNGIVPKTENGNHLYNRFDSNYGYDPAVVFGKYNFVESERREMIDTMVKELEKGKFVTVTPKDNDKHKTLKVAADPTYKDFALYDAKGKPMAFTDSFKHETFRRASQKAPVDGQPITHRSFSSGNTSTQPSGSIIDTHHTQRESPPENKKKVKDETEPVKRRPRKQPAIKPEKGPQKSMGKR